MASAATNERIGDEMEDYIVRWMGFPVVIEDPAFRMVLGEAVLDADPSLVEKKVCEALVFTGARLTGTEVRFLRHHMLVTQAELAKALVQSNHSIVSIWEGKGAEPTGMNAATEMLLRLLVAQRILDGATLLRAMDALPGSDFDCERAPIRIVLSTGRHDIVWSAPGTSIAGYAPGPVFPDWACLPDPELGVGRPLVSCRGMRPPADSWNMTNRGGEDVSIAA
jgi:DNA-binding transcriptional regulator YiaG